MAGKQEGSVTRRTAVGAAWLIGWRMVTRVLGVASTLILARILVPADFGLVAMAVAFSASVETLSRFGLQDALVRRHEIDKGVLDTAFTLQVARAVMTGAIVWISAPLVAAWFEEPRLVQLLWVLAGITVVNGLENVGIVDFRRAMRFDRQVLFMAVPRLGQVIVAVPLAFYLRSYWALIAGLVALSLLRVASSYIMHPHRPRFGLAHWRELLGFSFWMWAATLPALIWDRGDAFILGPAIGSANLGVYLLAFEIALLTVTELVMPASDALYSGFSLAQRKGTHALELALPVSTTLLVLVAPLVIAISALSGHIIGLIGPQWAEARVMIAILAFFCLFSPFSFVCGSALVAAGHYRTMLLARVISTCFKVGGLLILVAHTRSPEWLAIVIVLAVIIEGLIFSIFVAAASPTRPRIFGGLLRVTVASAATLLVLEASGLAWQTYLMSPVEAVLRGAVVGALTVCSFVVAMGILWYVAGRPEGPESRLLNLVHETSLARFLPRARPST